MKLNELKEKIRIKTDDKNFQRKCMYIPSAISVLAIIISLIVLLAH